MTQEQFNNLTPYFKYLKCAKYSHNVLLPHSDCIKILNIIYGEHWQNYVSPSFQSCGKCKLETLSKICTLYEDYVECNNRETT